MPGDRKQGRYRQSQDDGHQSEFNWAYRNGIIESLPFFPVAATSMAARYIPPTSQEVSALYEVAPEHLKRVIIVGFMFGMRVGPCEMLRLRWQYVDIRQGVISVPNTKKGIRTHGGKCPSVHPCCP